MRNRAKYLKYHIILHIFITYRLNLLIVFIFPFLSLQRCFTNKWKTESTIELTISPYVCYIIRYILCNIIYMYISTWHVTCARQMRKVTVTGLWFLLTEHYNEGHFDRLNFGSRDKSSRRYPPGVPSGSLA